MARAKLHEHFGVKTDECFVLYPVRCIRRKNVGEALLHAALAPSGTVVGLTLAPLNPAETPIYRMWKELAVELKLPCRFEVGAPGALRFHENLAAADRILTTSLAEGFGMVFLESWLAGRPLVGRDLPEITADFTRAGVRFDWLTSRVNVPVRWIGAETFCQSVARAYRQTLLAYGRQAPEGLDEAVAAKIVEETIDFGDLDETGQRQVLQRVFSSTSDRESLLKLNPRLARAFCLDAQTVETSIARNAQIIQDHYSLVSSGRLLVGLYRQMEGSARGGCAEPLADAPRILDRFLDLERFRLIRS